MKSRQAICCVFLRNTSVPYKNRADVAETIHVRERLRVAV